MKNLQILVSKVTSFSPLFHKGNENNSDSKNFNRQDVYKKPVKSLEVQAAKEKDISHDKIFVFHKKRRLDIET